MAKKRALPLPKRELAAIRETVMEAAGLGLYRQRLDGEITFMDATALNILDASALFSEPLAVIGKKLSDLMLSPVPETNGLVEEVRRQGSARGFEQAFRTLHGSDRWISHDAFLIRDPASGEEMIQSLVKDITDRKRAEETRYAESLRLALSAGLAASPLGMVLWEPEGEGARILDWNAAAERIFGWKREEVLGKNLLEFLPVTGNKPNAGGMLPLLMGELFSRHIEDECFTKSGRVLPVQWFNSPITLRSSRRIFVVSLGEDLSERKKAEKAVRESETRYRRITEAVTDYVYSVRVENGHPVETVHGPGCEAVTGYPLEAFRSAPYLWIDMVPEQDRDIVRRQASQILDGQDAPPIEHRIIRKDGSVRWVRNTTVAQHDAQDHLISYDGLIRDITEQKRAEDALRASEEKYRTILETMEDGYYEVDLNGNLTFCNEAMSRILGREKEEMTGLNYREFLETEDVGKAKELFNEVFRTGRSARAKNLRLLRKDGSACYVETPVALIRNAAGNASGFRGLARDISERIQAEEDRHELETQIQQTQKLESLGILAGGIAHDFNNLLMRILGNLELASAEIPRESAAQNNVREIEAAAKRAAELCQQMLAYAGKGKFLVAPLNITELTQEMTSLLRLTIAKEAILHCELSNEVPAINADPIQIRQIIMNLVTNASEALGNKPGKIILRTGAGRFDKKYLSECYFDDNLEEGVYTFLEVTDSGSGMDEDTLRKLFDPFFSTKFTGRGLGLAATLGIIRSHHGAIRVESTAGKGSTFRVLLPAEGTRSPAHAVQASVTKNACWQGSGTILIVDDEEAVRTLGKRMLERCGFSVLTACDGKEGVDVYQQCPDEIRAVVMDLTMPNMTGEEALEEMRKIRPGVKVILASGYSEQDLAAQSSQEHIAGFIQKPFHIATLIDALRRTLGE